VNIIKKEVDITK